MTLPKTPDGSTTLYDAIKDFENQKAWQQAATLIAMKSPDGRIDLSPDDMAKITMNSVTPRHKVEWWESPLGGLTIVVSEIDSDDG